MSLLKTRPAGGVFLEFFVVEKSQIVSVSVEYARWEEAKLWTAFPRALNINHPHCLVLPRGRSDSFYTSETCEASECQRFV